MRAKGRHTAVKTSIGFFDMCCVWVLNDCDDMSGGAEKDGDYCLADCSRTSVSIGVVLLPQFRERWFIGAGPV